MSEQKVCHAVRFALLMAFTLYWSLTMIHLLFEDSLKASEVTDTKGRRTGRSRIRFWRNYLYMMGMSSFFKLIVAGQIKLGPQLPLYTNHS